MHTQKKKEIILNLYRDYCEMMKKYPGILLSVNNGEDNGGVYFSDNTSFEVEFDSVCSEEFLLKMLEDENNWLN